jgi:hypothetical protein
VSVSFKVTAVFFKVPHALAFHKKTVTGISDAFSNMFGWYDHRLGGFDVHQRSVVGWVAFFFPIKEMFIG